MHLFSHPCNNNYMYINTWEINIYLSWVVILYEGGRYGMTEGVTSLRNHVLFNQKGHVYQLQEEKELILNR